MFWLRQRVLLILAIVFAACERGTCWGSQSSYGMFYMIQVKSQDSINIVKMETELRKKTILMLVISQLAHVILPLIFSGLVSGHSNEKELHGHSWLLNFDGVHYFNNRYEYQPNHAFLPFFVTFVQTCKRIFGDSLALWLLIAGNRVIFALSAFQVSNILRNLSGNDRKIVEIGTIIFIFNPASIFFHVLYTESLFCYFTCRAIRSCLEGRSVWVSALGLSLGVALRSSGLFLAPVIGLPLLSTFFSNLKLLKPAALPIFIKGCAIIVLLCLPFLFHLFISYVNVCVLQQNPPQICLNAFPNIYSYVQEKYWNVGLFHYFQRSNSIFILLGLPSILLSLYGIMTQYNSKWNLTQLGIYISFIILIFTTITMTNLQSSTRFFSTHPFFYYILAKLGIKSRMVRIWVILYYLLGIFLYTVGFPWT